MRDTAAVVGKASQVGRQIERVIGGKGQEDTEAYKEKKSRREIQMFQRAGSPFEQPMYQ